ncbi:MAG: peptidase domain-containing ABC transporter, partial [Candidatus Nitrosopelagicus sp.]|nr:peptidase domain-containing ABC transporter [Candidatus Nitrosopelagicus sp.]
MTTEATNIADKLQFWHKKKLSIILQSEAAECGLACLAMIADYHGYKTDLVSMRQKFNLSLGGATLHDIMQFSQSLHLTSRPLRIELDDLENLQTPCILHWNLNHFVVLKSASAKSIVIHDPAYGERCLKMSEVSGHFTG